MSVCSNDAGSPSRHDQGHTGLPAAQASSPADRQAGAQAGMLCHHVAVTVQSGCAPRKLRRTNASVQTASPGIVLTLIFLASLQSPVRPL